MGKSLEVWKRFRDSRNGNVAITFALASIPLLFAVGMGVDYTSAAYREDQLNAFADAAALAAVTPAMMASTDAASVTAATNTFNAQANAMTGVNYSASADVSVTTADTITTRTVTVTWTAGSQNSFPNVLGSTAIALGGSSVAVGALAPNINFYLLLDNSPSMGIAATTAGINTMVSNTSAQGGCAFACHETNPTSGDVAGNPGGEDNYTLARNLGVTLRIDNLVSASENLATTASSTETTNHAAYKMAVYTFDYATTKVAALTSNMTTVSNDASTITMPELYSNNYLTSSNDNQDEDTNFDLAMSTLNTAMPNPGNGTNSKGDTPQEVLFLVTDGVEDENVSGTRTYQISTTECTTIKARGIRIAVLYTEYLPLPTNTWYNDYVAPIQPDIAPTLEACASPGLYYEVTTDGDISSALTSLFQIAVQTSYLAK